MRVALEDAAVHESAGVALVGVADDVLPVPLGVVAGLPFDTGREARAAASADAGFFHLVDDVLRAFVLERFGDGDVTAAAYVRLDAVELDDAAFRARFLTCSLKSLYRRWRTYFLSDRS
jgi:hypothetical protein